MIGANHSAINRMNSYCKYLQREYIHLKWWGKRSNGRWVGKMAPINDAIKTVNANQYINMDKIFSN